MFNLLGKIILKTRIEKRELKTKRGFLPWNNIEKIALIIDKDNSLNKSVIDKFIDETKKHIEVFYIETKAKQKSFNDWHCFSRKEKSLFNLPNKTVEIELKNKQFDVIINTCDPTNLFALSIASSLRAFLRCGNNSSYNIADLIILKKESTLLIHYLENTVKYLKMIKV